MRTTPGLPRSRSPSFAAPRALGWLCPCTPPRTARVPPERDEGSTRRGKREHAAEGHLSLRHQEPVLLAPYSHRTIFSQETRKRFRYDGACQTRYLYLHPHHLLQLFSSPGNHNLKRLYSYCPLLTSPIKVPLLLSTSPPREALAQLQDLPDSPRSSPRARSQRRSWRSPEDGPAALSSPWAPAAGFSSSLCCGTSRSRSQI